MFYMGVRNDTECQYPVSILGVSDDATHHDVTSMACTSGSIIQWVEHVCHESWAMTPFSYAPWSSP